jgi:hypothetical protein
MRNRGQRTNTLKHKTGNYENREQRRENWEQRAGIRKQGTTENWKHGRESL